MQYLDTVELGNNDIARVVVIPVIGNTIPVIVILIGNNIPVILIGINIPVIVNKEKCGVIGYD